MGVFNALIVMPPAYTHVDSNIGLHLERMLKVYQGDRFDFFAIGAQYDLRFAALLHPTKGWLQSWPDYLDIPQDGDYTDEALVKIQKRFDDELSKLLADRAKGYVLVPIRCHG